VSPVFPEKKRRRLSLAMTNEDQSVVFRSKTARPAAAELRRGANAFLTHQPSRIGRRGFGVIRGLVEA
jgi:hypothetical protein